MIFFSLLTIWQIEPLKTLLVPKPAVCCAEAQHIAGSGTQGPTCILFWNIFFQVSSSSSNTTDAVPATSSPLPDSATVTHQPLSTKRPGSDSATSTPPKRFQLDLSGHVVKTLPGNKEELDTKVAEFVYGCNLPFSVVEHPLFLSMVDALRPGCKPPMHQKLSSSLLDNVHDSLQMDMKIKLEGN